MLMKKLTKIIIAIIAIALISSVVYFVFAGDKGAIESTDSAKTEDQDGEQADTSEPEAPDTEPLTEEDIVPARIEEPIGETEETNMKGIVTIETNKGTMKFQLETEKAPKTSQNFIDLAQKGYYDSLVFHRVIKDFMIQGGDPNGDGTGGPGYSIEDEFHPDLGHDKAGILSMANSGPNTGGSQFFVTLAATSWLDNKHAVFGHVIEGEDVLMAIGSVEVGPMDRPLEPIVMEKVTVE